MIAELAGEEKCFRDLLLRPEKESAEDERRGRSRKAEVRFGASGRYPKRSMAKQARGRGRYRSWYRKDGAWDSETRNRVPLRCRHNSEAKFGRARRQPERESISMSMSIPISISIQADNDRTDRPPPVHVHVLPTRTPTRTRRIIVNVNVYRFAVYVYVSGPNLRSSEKVNDEARSGSGSLSESVSKERGMGFGQEKPGTETELLRCRHNSEAKCGRARRQPE